MCKLVLLFLLLLKSLLLLMSLLCYCSFPAIAVVNAVEGATASDGCPLVRCNTVNTVAEGSLYRLFLKFHSALSRYTLDITVCTNSEAAWPSKHTEPEPNQQHLSSFASLKNITLRILRQRVVIETFQCLAEFENYVRKETSVLCHGFHVEPICKDLRLLAH